MITFETTVANPTGLHARPAKNMVNLAKKFSSTITVTKVGGQTVNAKSIFAVLSLGAVKGTDLVISISGEDQQQAYGAVKELFENNLGEDDNAK